MRQEVMRESRTKPGVVFACGVVLGWAWGMLFWMWCRPPAPPPPSQPARSGMAEVRPPSRALLSAGRYTLEVDLDPDDGRARLTWMY